jgi:plastocyanin
LLIGLSAAARAAEAGHALIVLKSDMAAVSPDPLKVKQGTTIIWVNECKEPVSIIIKTKVGIACKNPVNFYADLFGHYETRQILTGATASICFIDKGKFEYEVKRMIGQDQPVEKILPATIIVE